MRPGTARTSYIESFSDRDEGYSTPIPSNGVHKISPAVSEPASDRHVEPKGSLKGKSAGFTEKTSRPPNAEILHWRNRREPAAEPTDYQEARPAFAHNEPSGGYFSPYFAAHSNPLPHYNTPYTGVPYAFQVPHVWSPPIPAPAANAAEDDKDVQGNEMLARLEKIILDIKAEADMGRDKERARGLSLEENLAASQEAFKKREIELGAAQAAAKEAQQEERFARLEKLIVDHIIERPFGTGTSPGPIERSSDWSSAQPWSPQIVQSSARKSSFRNRLFGTNGG